MRKGRTPTKSEKPAGRAVAQRRRVRHRLALPAWLLCSACAAALCLHLTASAQSYVILDLGDLGGSYSEAHGLNNIGNVVGDYDMGSPWTRAFYYHDGTNSSLPNLGGVYGLAYGINDSAVIVGESSVVGGPVSDTHAFVYSYGTISDLGTLGGTYFGGYSSAHAINPSGQIVGESSLSAVQSRITHAVLFNGGTITDLGTLGSDYSSANGINRSGVIVGEASVVSGSVTNVHAFLYANNVMSDLGTLGGGYSSARAINDSGVIVGEAEIVIGGVTNLHAFVRQGGNMNDLGTFGGPSSSAGAVNNSGIVVGYSYDPNQTSWAFLYDGSNMVNLIDRIPANSGWTNLTSADAINDLGQIAGSGLLTNGAYHAYLLTPVTSGSPPSPVLLSNPIFNGTSLTFSFLTQTGYTYEAQFATDLSSSGNWLSFTNLAGNGSIVQITDSTLTNSQRYYRVMAH